MMMESYSKLHKAAITPLDDSPSDAFMIEFCIAV